MRVKNDRQFARLVKGSVSVRQVLIAVGLRPAGGNYATIKRRIATLNLDTSHFLGMAANRGRRFPSRPARSLDEILVRDSTYHGGSWKLKRRLLKEGVLEYRCYRCGRTRWLGRPIPLELEHRNGVPDDLRIENLTLLCPNCHALTPTYRARNVASCRARNGLAQVV